MVAAAATETSFPYAPALSLVNPSQYLPVWRRKARESGLFFCFKIGFPSPQPSPATISAELVDPATFQ